MPNHNYDKSMQMIKTFLNELNANHISYVHWKSNNNIELAISGIDDLDILVSPEDKDKINSIFSKLNILRAYSVKDDWQTGITHHIGLDIESLKLVHVHLHYELSIGYDYDKGYNLPIVEKYLKGRSLYKDTVYLPTYENEYCILVIRLILKNSLTPFLQNLPHNQLKIYKKSKNAGVIDKKAYAEYEYLKSKIDQTALQSCLKENFGFISPRTFSECEKTIQNNNSLKDFFKTAKCLKEELKSYRNYGEVASFMKSFYRLYSIRFFSILRKLKVYNKNYSKTPEFGGRIFAFVGGDGAGKSTTIGNLRKLLSQQFAVKSIHVGRPGNSFQGSILTISSKLFSLIGQRDLSKALRLLAVAFNRKKAFGKAIEYRGKGFIVLQDRIPLKGITQMDCPRIHTIRKGRFKRLSLIESRIYKKFKGIDELFVLKLNPEIALQRRPEDNAEELRMRSGEIWEDKWDAPYALAVNTGENNPEQVQKIFADKIWKSLSKPYKRIEIIGLNGTGKSTLCSNIRKYYPNLYEKINVKEHPAELFRSLLLNFFPATRVYFKTRNLNFAKIYIRFYVTMYVLRKWHKYDRYPQSDIIFDQGPVFKASFLYHDGLISRPRYLKYIGEIQNYVPAIVFLNAQTETLYSRLKERQGTNARGQYMNEESFFEFCATYQSIFQEIFQNYKDKIEINTEEISQEKVFQEFKIFLDEKKFVH